MEVGIILLWMSVRTKWRNGMFVCTLAGEGLLYHDVTRAIRALVTSLFHSTHSSYESSSVHILKSTINIEMWATLLYDCTVNPYSVTNLTEKYSLSENK